MQILLLLLNKHSLDHWRRDISLYEHGRRHMPDELSSALSLGLEAEDKLRWKVREDTQGREIFFINATEAWIVPAIGVVQGLFGINMFSRESWIEGKAE